MRVISDGSASNEPEQEIVREPTHSQAVTAQRSSDRISSEVSVASPNQPVLDPAAIGAILLLPVLIIAVSLSYRKQQRNIHRQQVRRLEKLWQLSPQSNWER